MYSNEDRSDYESDFSSRRSSYDTDYESDSDSRRATKSRRRSLSSSSRSRVLDNLDNYEEELGYESDCKKDRYSSDEDSEYRSSSRRRRSSDARTRGEAVREAIKYGDLRVSVNESEMNGDNVEYALDVDTGDNKWTVWYRYSDFESFDDELLMGERMVGVFPKKRLMKTSKMVRKERVDSFNEYINTLVDDEDVCSHNLFVSFVCENIRLTASS